ncbi:MAG TPA: PEP-CTERM sorting domain-containing protein, partial [Tepidisphaeraceae bacterium]|nr:PEP-CTERM sorting domain-containing protein [Tepidisphaeraceae bacterium]
AFTGGFAVPTGTLVAGLSRSNTLGTGGITLSGGKLALQGQQTPTGTPAAAAAVAVTGFNKDVIYGNPDSSSFSTNTSGLDNVFGFYQTGYTPQFNPTTTIQNAGTQLSSGGLPGQNITSALAGSKPFSFQSFMANNALAIAKGSTGTLSLSTPAAFANLSLLASSTNAADDTPNVTINFADGGSVTTTYKAYDWFIGTDTLRQNASVFGAAGVFRYSASTAPGWDQRAFGLYESDIDLTNINGVDYSKRPIASLTFAATSATNGQTDVFAVSGAARAWANGASQSYANNVSVTADSGIDVSGSLAATLGTLNIGSNKLSVTSADATSSPYSLSFGATTVSGAATIDVAPSTGGGVGTVTLGNVCGGGSITKTNTGTLKFAGTTNAISGNLAINGGNAVVAFSPGGGATPASLSVALLSFSGGKLDLTDNKLFTTLPVANVKSAMSANTLFTSSTGGVLGYMDTGSGTTEVRFTLPGDTNLDGAVDVADLGALATSYGTTAGALWAQGDANGDGAVNVADLGLVATNYGQSIGAGTVDASSAAVASSTAVVAGSASVPEPTSLGLIGGLSIAVAARRRRR